MANIDSTSFNAHPFPPEVVSEILHIGLAGAPVFDSLTPRTTSRGSLVFATGDPSGFDWVAELGEIPAVDPGDDSAAVAVTKLAGLLLLGNEAIGDSELNLTSEVGRIISESMAAKADVDLLYGVTPAAPEAPVGVFDDLTNVSEATLRASVVAAASDIMTAGGTPTTVILSPALWAAEMTRRETTPSAVGALFDDLGLGLDVKVAATLTATDGLVIDKAGCFGILRNDYSIEASSQAGTAWTHDGVSLRVKARLAMAIPSPAKHARSIAVDTTP
jgi:hypothetical protein